MDFKDGIYKARGYNNERVILYTMNLGIGIGYSVIEGEAEGLKNVGVLDYNSSFIKTFSPYAKTIDKVMFKNDKTIIKFINGDTSVATHSDLNEFDEEKGFMAAYLKHLLKIDKDGALYAEYRDIVNDILHK